MALITWDAFYDHILPELNGVTPGMVDLELRQVCIDFCEQTGIYTAEVTPINVVAGTASYALTTTEEEAEAYRIKAAWFDSRPLDYAPIDALNSYNQYWPSLTSTESYAYTQKQPDTVILFPKPDTALTGGLRVELILRPAQDSTGLIDWVATRYMRALAAGVKARLMAQPDRPWSRPDYAANYGAEYVSARSLAEVDVNRSFVRSALSVRPRPFA